MDKNDYKDFVKLWKRSPNPSNQNFHNKLIRAISMNNEVEVISVRPFSHTYCEVKSLKPEEKKIDNIFWRYIYVHGNKITRPFHNYRNAVKLFSKRKNEDAIILTDTINPTCIRIANFIGKKLDLRVIGICTDSPSNITGTNRAYTLYLLKQAKKCDGYIALTTGLNDLYNEEERPHIILEGIVENDTDSINKKEVKKPYFFFGGALLQRYGVYELIEAFKALDDKDVDLYIAGHSGNWDMINEKIKGYDNIKFLKTLHVDDILGYEKGAIANINPRPYSEDLDRYSIPSKTIEYLSSGRPTISVRNTKLMKNFSELAIWSKSSQVNELLFALNRIMELSEEERNTLGEKAKIKVNELYSFTSVNQKINEFLNLFKK